MTAQIYHALGLHMHQPPNNLPFLLETDNTAAVQILQCYARAVNYALKYQDIARLHVSFSGSLVEQLQAPKIIDKYRKHVDIPLMLESYRTADNIELLGMGYYHPLFALIPSHDWAAHIQRGFDIIKDTFGRAPKGFYPPEMAFSMELIPLLVKAGYQYAVVNTEFIQPHGGGVADVFAAYKAYHENAWINIIAIDRDFSQAQASGLDPVWFASESRRRVLCAEPADTPRLLTSWSSGENGDWFRNPDEGEGFFGHFFAPYMEHAEIGEFPTQPIAISEFLHVHPAAMSAHVESGAWHSGSSFGYGLSDWSGSPEQKQRVEHLQQLSARHAALRDRLSDAKAQTELAGIYDKLLESQSSCFICWGDKWLEKLTPRLRDIEAALDRLDPDKPAAKAVEKQATHIAQVMPDFAMDKIEALKIADAKAKAEAEAKAQAAAAARAQALAEVKAQAQAAIAGTLSGGHSQAALENAQKAPAAPQAAPKKTRQSAAKPPAEPTQTALPSRATKPTSNRPTTTTKKNPPTKRKTSSRVRSTSSKKSE